MRPMAYAKDFAARRRNGERCGLLVISVHGWESGKWFEGRPEVSRLLLPADVPVAEADWSVCLALDVLLCGPAPDEVFNAALLAAKDGGAASLWAEYEDGFHRLDGRRLLHSAEGPYTVGELGAALRAFRPVAIGLRIGMYGSRVFDAARAAMAAPFLEAMAE